MSNHRIRKINLATNTVSTLVGNGTASATDGIGTSATLYYPKGLALDSVNNVLYFVQGEADRYSNSYAYIRKVSLSNSQVTSVHRETMSASWSPSYGALNGNPYSIVLDTTSNAIYVSYTSYNPSGYYGSWISRIDLTTDISTIIAGYPPFGYWTPHYYGYAEGITTASRLGRWVGGMFLDTTNKVLYFADQENSRIRTVEVRNYKTPEFIALTLYKRDTSGASIPVGGTNPFRETLFQYQFRDLDTADIVKIDMEVKPLETAFDGTNLISPQSYTTAEGTLYTKSWIVGKPLLNYGQSYHIRYRITDYDGFTTGWVSYG